MPPTGLEQLQAAFGANVAAGGSPPPRKKPKHRGRKRRGRRGPQDKRDQLIAQFQAKHARR